MNLKKNFINPSHFRSTQRVRRGDASSAHSRGDVDEGDERRRSLGRRTASRARAQRHDRGSAQGTRVPGPRPPNFAGGSRSHRPQIRQEARRQDGVQGELGWKSVM